MLNVKMHITLEASGTPDAIIVESKPVPITLSDRITFGFRSSGANTTAAPTLNADGTGAKVITKNGGSPLLAGDIGAVGSVAFVCFDKTNDRWELINPRKPYLFSNIISPPSFSVNQNNYNPTGLEDAEVLRLTSSGPRQITGLVAPSPVRSVTKRLINIGGSNITIVNSSASSVADNRFLSNGNQILGSNEAFDIWYDTTSLRWRPVVH